MSGTFALKGNNFTTETSIEGMLTKSQRLILGLLVLLLVDIIWVSSSEITQYIYKGQKFDKPFFLTYFKTSLFSLYLLGMFFWPPWKDQCNKQPAYMYLDPNTEEDSSYSERNTSLSDPQFVPIKKSDRGSGTESDDSSVHSVRFSKMAEVRQMSDADATEALLARLSYQATIKAGEAARRSANKFSINEVAKIAFTFCLMWFIANYTYEASLNQSETGIFTLIATTSSLFTLLLSAMFPSSSGDRFTISKLVAICVSIGGLILVSLSNFSLEKKLTAGAILALVSGFFYAAYLIFLRKKVDNEDKIDIPMFLGFVGLFNMILMWPLFFFLHYNNWEPFEWPSKDQWMSLLLNGFIGTVLSEVLWLWGCFLTSSLVATMAIGLTIPMAMMVDILFKDVKHPYMFYVGCIPTLFSFVAVIVLAQFEDWDPVRDGLKKLYDYLVKNVKIVKVDDSEQTEALIGINNEEQDA